MGLDSRYEIRIDGILDGRWAAWFEGLQVSSDGDETVIAGRSPIRPPCTGC
jgi:hypothetical protein